MQKAVKSASVLLWASAFLIPALGWSQNALIVHDGDPGIEANALANLTTKLATASFTVTASVGVPGGSLAGYQQIWDIRFNISSPLSGPDISAYVAYMSGGGSLFVMGENTAFAARNTSIISLVAIAGGGTITVVDPVSATQTVMPPFTGPNSITANTLTFQAPGGIPLPPGTGADVTRDGNNIAAGIVFAPGRLSAAPAGSLVIVLDVNFLQASGDANSQAFTANLISYLSAPTAVGTPAPSSLVLVLIGLGGAVAFETLRRRNRRRSNAAV